MSEYKNLIVDVSELEEGKFYKVYTDSNGTTLLIPKEKEDALIQGVTDNTNRITALEEEEASMSISNSPNAVINIIKDNIENKYKRVEVNNITEITIPYVGTVSNVKVFNKINSNIQNTNLYEQIEEGVQIIYSENTLNKQKQILINSNSPITGYIEVFNF